jgi:hypothetical protein
MLTAFETYWQNELFRFAFVSGLALLGGALYWLERLLWGIAEHGHYAITITGSIG